LLLNKIAGNNTVPQRRNVPSLVEIAVRIQTLQNEVHYLKEEIEQVTLLLSTLL
jgi:hypothetical protein